MLAALAPFGWAATDLILTGDPLYSLNTTRVLADELGRARTAPIALVLVPSLLSLVLGLPLLVGSAISLGAFVDRPPKYFGVVVGALSLSLLGFIAIGALGLPLLARYLFFPAALLAVLACGAAIPRRGESRWPAGVIAGVCVSIGLLASLPGTAKGVKDAFSRARAERVIQADLRTLVTGDAFRRQVAVCKPLAVASYRLVPRVAYAGSIAPSEIETVAGGGTLILPRSGRAVSSLGECVRRDASPCRPACELPADR